VKLEQVIIVGAGPAGLATALQLERYGIKPLVLEMERIGGLLHNANLVENYPGFPGGIPGFQLVQLFKQQVKDYELNLLDSKLEKLEYSNGKFKFLVDGSIYQSLIAVIASGTKPRRMENLNIPEELLGKFSYEVFPLLGEAGKQIAIIGAGDAAFDYALNLAKRNKVMILNRGSEISCLPLLWERTEAEDNIQYHPQTSVLRLSPGPAGRITLACNNSKTFIVDHLIAAIGRDPNLDFVSGQFSKKVIKLENSGMLYFVGDVANGLYRQTAIAVGDGILAAMKIYKFLKEKV
jgi:thioredoxin reductase